jgi:hypothetical protein
VCVCDVCVCGVRECVCRKSGSGYKSVDAEMECGECVESGLEGVV